MIYFDPLKIEALYNRLGLKFNPHQLVSEGVINIMNAIVQKIEALELKVDSLEMSHKRYGGQ